MNLTKTPCSERVKKLEKTGVISGYHAILRPSEVGINHLSIVHVSLAKTNNHTLDNFNEAVKQIPEVESCLLIAGSFDYMLKVRTKDMSQFHKLLGDRIGKLPYVMQTQSFAVMETVKENKNIEIQKNQPCCSSVRFCANTRFLRRLLDITLDLARSDATSP